MSVEETGVVDFIGLTEVSDAVHLTISDHLPWSDEHLLVLQEKLNCYLAFLESGEVYEAYPDAVGRQFVIHAVFKYRPSMQAAAFLQQASHAIATAGFKLTHGPSDLGYADDA